MPIQIERCTQHPSSEQELKSVEHELGVNLPPDYRAFLLEKNCGEPERNELSESQGAGVSVRRFLGVTADSSHGLAAHARAYRDRLPPGLLPIAGDSFGNLLCLRVSGPDYGAVYFWDHELEADENEPATHQNTIRLADSFSSFLAQLVPERLRSMPSGKGTTTKVDLDFLEEQRRKGNLK